jgi:hypothetical protein
MSPRRKPNQPAMKYWGFYATEELKAETIKCAETLNESDSEYIRRAVEQRNTQQNSDVLLTDRKEIEARLKYGYEKMRVEEIKKQALCITESSKQQLADSTHNTVSKPERLCFQCGKPLVDKVSNVCPDCVKDREQYKQEQNSNPTIPELKEKVKEVQTFMKGEKK